MLIGDVAQRSGISTRMLRHYDAVGLVVPSARTAGGYREYSADDMRRLFHVEALRSLGLPLADVARALDEPGFAPAALVDEMIERSRATIARERELLARLEHVRGAGPGQWADVLEVVGLLRGLASQRPEERQRTALATDEGTALPASALADAVLAEDDPNVAGALQWALARSGDDAVPMLAAAMGDAEPGIRRRAAVALVKLGTTSARAALAPALADADEVVRAKAALALGRAGDRAAEGELLRMIVDGTDDVDAAEALAAVARAHGREPQAVAAIGDALAAAATPPEARARLAQALAELPRADADGLLSVLAGDPDPAVARVASYLRGERGRDRTP